VNKAAYPTIITAKTHHLVKNNLEQTSHLDDQILEVVRPEPLLIELVNN
jgi:hypothetical protein